jgi:hypothetical protein
MMVVVVVGFGPPRLASQRHGVRRGGVPGAGARHAGGAEPLAGGVGAAERRRRRRRLPHFRRAAARCGAGSLVAQEQGGGSAWQC